MTEILYRAPVGMSNEIFQCVFAMERDTTFVCGGHMKVTPNDFFFQVINVTTIHSALLKWGEPCI